MGLPATLIGWKGYAMALAAGALLVAGFALERRIYGARQYQAGVTHTQLEAAANARQIDAAYRRQEQELVADYTGRLEKANEATRISNTERDLAAGAVGSLRDTIDAERTRATQAAARAGLSERTAARAWDVLKACTDEYAALAANADAAIDRLRPGDAWAKAAARAKP